MTDQATAPPANRQQERTERSAAALLDAAADLIVEGGFSSLTLAAIGERAGYSRGLVTARFGSKDGLIDALIERIVTTWSHKNITARVKGRTGIEGALRFTDAIRAQAAKDSWGLRVLYALMFEAGTDQILRARFAKLHADMRNDFAYFVKKGQRDGTITRGIDADAEAALVVGAIRGIGYQWQLDPEGFDVVGALSYLTSTNEARLRVPDAP